MKGLPLWAQVLLVWSSRYAAKKRKAKRVKR